MLSSPSLPSSSPFTFRSSSLFSLYRPFPKQTPPMPNHVLSIKYVTRSARLQSSMSTTTVPFGEPRRPKVMDAAADSNEPVDPRPSPFEERCQFARKSSEAELLESGHGTPLQPRDAFGDFVDSDGRLSVSKGKGADANESSNGFTGGTGGSRPQSCSPLRNPRDPEMHIGAGAVQMVEVSPQTGSISHPESVG
ncbi:hypothetical protein GYMLUDRAFT_245388 [Collybiopsis luxurians FD-317 M1]|uniref:Uncharacterized protein n=1 Tax=Collybiopsis luxurians FD-317 M1 TaxID=944289 RepID=A0A0D0CU25_9AGAR|nr:hypothetical protein GYMLUDRAFT_245388 [Collybiopsis luxurians FD-317 M1]